MIRNKLRPLNLPQPVQVRLDDGGLPLSVTPRVVLSLHGSTDDALQGQTTGESRLSKAIEAIIEVWRIDDEWWRQPISRRYVEVVLEGGRHVVLYEELNTGNWFMQRI
jgi:hypothetical protein